MSYYNNRESVANIAVGLMNRGWKVYGYRADESDPMTDYFSPASWGGIAEKNGFVLLVDIYGTGDSGLEITEKGYTVDYDKIRKLEVLRDDKAASEGERVNCQSQIDRMMKKEKESIQVVEKWPTFKHKNPGRCNWHIEKDGEIIAKGNGAFKCSGYLFGDYEAETMAKVNNFIDRIESHIENDEQLEKVIKKVVKKVIKPVEVARKEVKEGDLLTFDYHGHYWVAYSVNERTISYELLGSEKRGYQRLKNGKRYYDYVENISRNIEDGKIKIYELKEVEEVTEKVTYKKTKRKQKIQNENLIASNEEVVSKQTKNEKQNEHNSKQDLSLATFEKGTGSKGNGIEITFSEKPNKETRELMKAHGFKWGGWNRPSIWWAILTDETEAIAKQLAGCMTTDKSKQEKIEYPEININDCESYVIDQSLQDREHDANWVFRRSKRDHTREIQDLYKHYTCEVEKVISNIDNDFYTYKIKESLQRFKKKYYDTYNKYLNVKASNPHWGVTGRGNLNVNKYNKAVNRQNNLMMELASLPKEFEESLKKYKFKNKRDKERKVNQQIENTNINIKFNTERKTFSFMGLTETKRVYSYEDIFISKSWGCFRIFKELSSGDVIELHSMKTTQKLDDAKKYVSYLMQEKESS